MIKEFKTKLNQDKFTLIGIVESEDCLLEINWAAEFNFRENGLVEPPVVIFQNATLTVNKTIVAVTTHNIEGAFIDEEYGGGIESEEIEISDKDWEIKFWDKDMVENIYLSGLMITEVEVDLKSKKITIG